MSMSSPEQSPGAVLGQPTEQQQRIARITGVLWIVTFITSIPAYLIYNPVLDDTGFITGTGSENAVLVGAFLELLLIIANIGTAVVPYSIYKRQSEPLALGFVAATRHGIHVHPRRDPQHAGARDLARGPGGNQHRLRHARDGRQVARRRQGVDIRLGPGFVVGVGNGLIMGALAYRSGLVPRRMAMLGSSAVR